MYNSACRLSAHRYTLCTCRHQGHSLTPWRRTSLRTHPWKT